jgi:TrmH family RNA methyltransferase
MISKARLKYIKSLQLKKYRKQEQCFIVEGVKSVSEVLRSHFEVMWVAVSPSREMDISALRKSSGIELVTATESE